MHLADRIKENFNIDTPSEYVYKITGVRGSGKTVVLSDIIRHFKSEEQQKNGWLVYDLSSARDPLHTLVSFLANEETLTGKRRLSKVSLEINTGILNANISTDEASKDSYYDDEVELDKLLEKAFSKKILE